PGLVTVAGYTYSWNFLTTPGALRRSPISPVDWDMAFAMRFSFPATGGGVLKWSTLLGGPGNQDATDVAVDSAGNAIIAGQAAADFPTTGGSFDRSPAGGRRGEDAFVSRVSADGSQLLYSTLLGGSSLEREPRVVPNGPDSVIVAGWTLSPDFPTTPGAFQTLFGHIGTSDFFNTYDGFVSQMTLLPNATTGTPVAPTLLGPADVTTFPFSSTTVA